MGITMTKDKSRETNRQDIWFTSSDTERIEIIASEMNKKGISPYGRFGKVNSSKVVRWALEQVCQTLENCENKQNHLTT